MKIEEIKKRITPILKEYDVKKMSVFGSVARGENKKNSDIDILIDFKGKKTLLDLISLENSLEEILGRKVDLLTYGSIHPKLRNLILKDQKIIYGKRS